MSTSRRGFGSMDCIRSDRILSWKANALCSHVGMLLLLSFAICIPGAVGSGHERYFQLRVRRLLAPPPDGRVLAISSSSPRGFVLRSSAHIPPPPPTSSPSLSPSHPHLAPHQSMPPPTSSPSPSPSHPHLAPHQSMPPPPVSPIHPPSPTAVPPSSPPLKSPSPSESPPVKPPLPPPPSTIVSPGSTWNESEKAGVLIAAIAALLQMAVVVFLLIKRHQMLTAVQYEDMDDDSDPDYRHPEDSA